ncbi:unnamed protein product [Effrenium voratum]|nr:unnamed protein product [Effrenium voratum]
MGNAALGVEAALTRPADGLEDSPQTRERARQDSAGSNAGSLEGPGGETLNIVVRGEAPNLPPPPPAPEHSSSNSCATGSTASAGTAASAPSASLASASVSGHWQPQAWQGFQANLAPVTALEAEAESRRRAAQILALSRQVEATQAELTQLRQPKPAQTRQLMGVCRKELQGLQARLSHVTHIAAQLDSWFVAHREHLTIEDTSQTPSAQLQQRLKCCEGIVEGFQLTSERMEGILLQDGHLRESTVRDLFC